MSDDDMNNLALEWRSYAVRDLVPSLETCYPLQRNDEFALAVYEYMLKFLTLEDIEGNDLAELVETTLSEFDHDLTDRLGMERYKFDVCIKENHDDPLFDITTYCGKEPISVFKLSRNTALLMKQKRARE